MIRLQDAGGDDDPGNQWQIDCLKKIEEGYGSTGSVANSFLSSRATNYIPIRGNKMSEQQSYKGQL